MSQAQDPSADVVQAACKIVFPSSAAKYRVASEVLVAARKASSQVKATQLSLQQAAKAAHVPPKDLLLLLRGDPCFRLVQHPAGGPAQYGVCLNVANIISRARGATSTGVLTEELPPPKGYVNGKHPIRPGQPDCKQFVRFGECAYNQRCVFNHPGKPSAAQHTQQHADQHPRAAALPIPPVPAPPPKHPAWGGAGVAHAVSGGAAAAAVSTNSTSILPHPSAERSAEAPTNSHTNSMPNTPSGQADAAQKHVCDQQQQESTPQSQQQVPALQPQQVPPQPAQAQALQQQQPHAPQQRLPPGFAPQQRQSRPCHFMTLRGFCPMGDRCPYDHPARPGASSLATAASRSQQPVPHISTATTPSATQSDALSATAEPVTPEALAVPAAPAPAPAAENPTALTAGAGSSNTAGQAASSSSSSSFDAVAAAPRSWRELLAGPQAAQQQDGQQVQETVPAAAATVPTSPTAAPAAAEDNGRLLGWTEGCLPQLRGVSNCPFYMGTGTCQFKERCLYHHPPQAEHPVCVMHGKLPRRFNANNRAPYARLVSHLYRLWDYDSCVEAQLKIWLAKHLLNKNNPDSHMFSNTASKPVGNFCYGWQRVGPYSCSMGEAGVVLHDIWRAQPDPASLQPFPYTKKLRELLSGDPYFSVVVDPDCNSHYWVKLEVDKIKGMLNF